MPVEAPAPEGPTGDRTPAGRTRLPSTGRAGHRSGTAVRRLAAPVLALGLLLGTTACYTNTGAVSQRDYQPADGVDGASGLIKVRNMQIVSTGRGGTLVGAIVNDSRAADTLQGVTVGTTPVQLTLTSPTLAPLTLVSFGTAGGPQGFVTGTFTPGQLVPVRVVFGTAAPVELQVPVYPRYDYLTGVPTPGASVPAASPTTTLGASPGTPSPSGTVLTPDPGGQQGLSPSPGSTVTPGAGQSSAPSSSAPSPSS